MYDVYYAHHQWKYGTPVEAYELDVIRRYFPNAKIFNPSTDLKSLSPKLDEASIMEECLETVRNSYILVFSSLDGCIGTGVYHEIMEAQNNGLLIFYIYHDTLTFNYRVKKRSYITRTDRLYANVVTDINQICEGASTYRGSFIFLSDK